MGRHQKDFTAFGDSVDLTSALALGASPSANDVATTTATAMAARGDAPAVNYGGVAGDNAASAGTYAQLADYLVNGYWAKDGLPAHGWTPGSTVTYNISGLNAQEQGYARQAFALWHDVANINFSEVGVGGQITFDDSGSMQAVTNVSWNGSNVLTSANVHISTDWVNTNGGYGGSTAGFWNYGFQTYLHEIGHAMGLGHQGPYNGSATWGVSNIFTNDSWQYTVMSYFDQTNSGLGSFDFTITPMVVDILAMQTKYGANTTTRTGDTTYGFNSNAGSFFNFSSYTGAPAFTIYDAGGTDTLDCSGYSQNQTFNMIAGGYCSVGGQTNNIGIALSTLLENAIGGSGADTFNGNDLNNTFRGNAGNDTINGGNGTDTAVFSGNRASYTLTDLGGGSVRVVGPDGTDTLTSIEKLQFADQTITWPPTVTHVANDFDGDGRADILWRNSSSGDVRLWELNGGTINANLAVDTVNSAWQIAGTGDFNGDGHTDILWRNGTTGATLLWEMSGPHVDANLTVSTVTTNWQIIGTADFNGDNREDILWRNSADGSLRIWQMNGEHVDANLGISDVPSAWHLESTGDFDGDGKADLLWRNASDGRMQLWEMNGGTLKASLSVSTTPVATWTIAGTGDFNGDGREDILWQNKNDGTMRLWEMNGNQVTANLDLSGAPNPWHVEDTRDVNGDGKDDILWRNTSDGSIRVWLMTDNHVDSNLSLTSAPAAWKVAADAFDHV